MTSNRAPVALDTVDLAILEVLQSDGRASVQSIADRTKVSRATAYSRIARLEESGVLRGYAASVDHEAAGLEVTAVVLVNGGQGSRDPLKELLRQLPHVEKAWYVTGLADILLVVRAESITALRRDVLERIADMPGVRSTQTMIAIEQVVDLPFVLPQAP